MKVVVVVIMNLKMINQQTIRYFSLIESVLIVEGFMTISYRIYNLFKLCWFQKKLIINEYKGYSDVKFLLKLELCLKNLFIKFILMCDSLKSKKKN